MTDKTQPTAAPGKYWARLCALPKFSFILSAAGGVARAQDSCGNWVEASAVQQIVDDAESRIAELEALQAAPPAPAAVAVQPEDMRDKVTLALGLSLAPKGGPSFAWSYLLDSIRELVKCEEELVLLKAGQEMSKARAALAAAPAQAPAQWIDDPHDIEQGRMLNPEWVRAQEHATQLAGQVQENCLVLDGDWRRRMLDGSAITRDEMGCGEHPALPVLEEGMKPKQFFDALGIELAGVMAEDQVDMDAYDAMVEATNYNVWTPEAPAGDGWVLVAIFYTDDGPAAWWMREAAPEQPARKNRKAAPAQAQEDASDAVERAERYEDALRHIAENAFANKDWTFAQLILNGHSIDAARAAQGGA